MGLNLVEALLVGASVELTSRRDIVSPIDATREEDAALTIIAIGMNLAGFRYRRGVLRFGGSYYYEGITGRDLLRAGV